MRARLASLFVVAAVLVFGSISSAIDRLVPSEYPTTQAAIDAAVDGDKVIIAPGKYTGDGNRDTDFKGKAIAVQSIDPNDPNVVAATIIDCEGQGRGFYLKGCAGATIAGLTITNGLSEAGGGIYIENGDVTIRDCQIIGNATKDGQDGWWEDNPSLPPGQDATDGGDGGGIYCESSSATIVDCNISGNMTGAGGAWLTNYYRGDAGNGGNGGAVFSTMCSLSMEGCIINGNATGTGGSSESSWAWAHSGGCGGAVYIAGSNVTISHCSLSGNRAGDGGKGERVSGRGGKGGCGAGIYCDQSCSIEIHGSDVRDNIAGTGGVPQGPGGDGAGIYCTSTVPLLVGDCNITGNQAGQPPGSGYPGASGYGGGIYCTLAKIWNSTIADNSTADGRAELWGGDGGCGAGVYCVESVELIDCTITGNITGSGGEGGSEQGGKGGDGGGVWASSVVAADCTIANNKTGHSGRGGIHRVNKRAGDGAGIFCTKAVLSGCKLINNNTGDGGPHFTQAGSGGNGGGILCSSGTIADCFIYGNRTGRGGDGWTFSGGGGDGAGIYCDSARVANCLIEGNVTGDAGTGGTVIWSGGNGAGVYGESASIVNCTIVANTTGSSQYPALPRGSGGGIYAGSETTVIHSIIWGNSPEQLFAHDCNNVSYCDIEHDTCIGGLGNISLDPVFVRPGHWVDVNDPNIVVEPNDPNAVWVMGDYHLSQVAARQAVNSPCVDAGSDLAVNLGMDKFTTRTDNVGDTGIVDMGYHYPMPNAADIDGDGDVDLTDFAILAGHWELATMEIPMGSAIVDGDISEWSEGVNWIPLDKTYYGNPADVRDAKYALRWSPDTDKIYVAVMVNDSNHVFSDEYIKWDVSDRIEIYSQGDAEGGTGWLRVYDVAQQYMMGPNTSGGSWATWAYGEALGTDVGLEYAVAVNGDQIIHEAGVLMFDNYAGFSGGTTIVTELKPGHVVGFDVLVSSRWESDGFGMLSENLMTGKSEDAAQFARYTLAERTSVSPYAAQAADLDESGIIDWFDLAVLAENWLWHTRW